MKEAIQTLITSDKMAHAFEYLKQDEAHTIDQQIELVQISSFSPFEEKRAIRFKELLTEAGLDPVMDEVHNVYAHIHGTGNGPTLYVSAHLDTVFPPETPLPVKREGTKIYAPGIGDDTRGLAEILTLARAIKESGLKPVGDIIIGGNVGEEGLGDLRGMRHFFSQNADKVDGFISVDGAGCLICHGGKPPLRGNLPRTGWTFLRCLRSCQSDLCHGACYLLYLRAPHPERTEDYLLRRCRKRRNLHQCHRV